MAKELGVSRTPVREAIHILEQQRLVEIRPKYGTFIAKLDWEEVHDSLSVRTVLEQLAVQQAMERLGSEEWNELCAKLQDVLNRMLDAESREDAVRSVELDRVAYTADRCRPERMSFAHLAHRRSVHSRLVARTRDLLLQPPVSCASSRAA